MSMASGAGGGGNAAGASGAHGGADEEATMLAQRCNVCYSLSRGQCFRTACRHLYCESCAFSHFGSNKICAVCSVSLCESDVKELIVGMGLPSGGTFSDTIFQEIYQGDSLPEVALSVLSASNVISDAIGFVMEQMARAGQREAALAADAQSDAAKLKHENGRLSMQLRTDTAALEARLRQVETKLQLREREHLELQEAYKEKLRKCRAWEKAYANLRSQLQMQTQNMAGQQAAEYENPSDHCTGSDLARPPPSSCGAFAAEEAFHNQLRPQGARHVATPDSYNINSQRGGSRLIPQRPQFTLGPPGEACYIEKISNPYNPHTSGRNPFQGLPKSGYRASNM